MAKSLADLFGGSGNDFLGSLNAEPPRPVEPDPLAGVEYTGDLEHDSAVELDALQAAFRKRRKDEDTRKRDATDSEFWFAVCFQTRAEKDAFLARFGLAELGDKYLDGEKVAAILESSE